MNAIHATPLEVVTRIGSFFGVVMDVLSPRDARSVEIAFDTLDGRRFRCTVPRAVAEPAAVEVGAYVQISGVEMGPNYIHAERLHKSDNVYFQHA